MNTKSTAEILKRKLLALDPSKIKQIAARMADFEFSGGKCMNWHCGTRQHGHTGVQG